jgi:hypothetical protein
MSEHTDKSSIDGTIDYNPLLLRSIVKDVEGAKTHLNNHATIEEEILTLDKNFLIFLYSILLILS